MPNNSIQALVRDLRMFAARKEVIKNLRSDLREPVPDIRRTIKREAVFVLPHRGGLGVWVARTKITAEIRITGYSVRMRMRGGRNSKGGRSDVAAIDRGHVRHPSWGRRGPGQWHREAVNPRFFSGPAGSVDVWRPVIAAATDRAFNVLRRG